MTSNGTGRTQNDANILRTLVNIGIDDDTLLNAFRSLVNGGGSSPTQPSQFEYSSQVGIGPGSVLHQESTLEALPGWDLEEDEEPPIGQQTRSRRFSTAFSLSSTSSKSSDSDMGHFEGWTKSQKDWNKDGIDAVGFSPKGQHGVLIRKIVNESGKDVKEMVKLKFWGNNGAHFTTNPRVVGIEDRGMLSDGDGITSISLSRNLVAVASKKKVTIYMFSGRTMLSVPIPPAETPTKIFPLRAVCLSPLDNAVCVGTSQGTYLWRIMVGSTADSEASFELLTDRVTKLDLEGIYHAQAIAFSKIWIAVGAVSNESTDGARASRLFIFREDTQTGSAQRQFDIPHEDGTAYNRGVSSLAFTNSDEELIYSVWSRKGCPQLFNIDTGRISDIRDKARKSSAIQSLAVSPQGFGDDVVFVYHNGYVQVAGSKPFSVKLEKSASRPISVGKAAVRITATSPRKVMVMDVGGCLKIIDIRR